MSNKNQRLLFILGISTLIIALFFRVNVPDLKDASEIYILILLTVLISLLVVRVVFHGKLKL